MSSEPHRHGHDDLHGIHSHLQAEGPLRTNAELDYDPTKTLTLRNAAVGRGNSRWRGIRGDANRELRDLLDSSRSDAQASVEEWLRATLNESVLEPMPKGSVKDGNHWTANYVEQAYEAGLRRAHEYLNKQGYDRPAKKRDPAVNSSRSVHQSALRQARWDTYKDLRTAVHAARDDAADSASDAIRDGAAATAIIALVKKRLDAEGQTRTAMVMNSRVVGTVNSAALESYGLAGVDAVGVRIESEVTGPNTDRGIFTGEPPEETDPAGRRDVQGGGEDAPTDPDEALVWATAGDQRVCVRCLLLEGRTWTLEEVRSGSGKRPPIHPRCRCVLIPAPNITSTPETAAT